MKGVFIFLIAFCCAVTVFVFRPSQIPALKQPVANNTQASLNTNSSTTDKQSSNSVHLEPNLNQPESFETQALVTFAQSPLTEVDKNKYRNFFEESVVREGRLFQWYRPNLTYAIDRATERRITKSKVRRAFEHWARESKIFTFQEVDDAEKADIFIQVASASQKDRMGEAGPDEAYENGKIQIGGRSISKYIVKHAKVTIAIDFFDYDKLKQYQQAQSDQGFQTLVHELGHVLGIMGHSPINGDCMYFQAHASGKACDELVSEINTLAMIYGRENSLNRGFYSQKHL